MRNIHRWIGSIVALFAFWFALTGIGLQGVDIATILSGAPATNPNMIAIRESIDGPPNQIVIGTQDYAASAFASDYDFGAGLTRLVRAARHALGPDASFRFIELRSGQNGGEGDVGLPDRVARFSLTDGRHLPDLVVPAQHGPQPSAHRTLKGLHRLFFLGDDMLWLNALVGLGVCVLIITGLSVYFRLLVARRKMRRPGLFWQAGGPWRSLHRGVSVVAAAFLLVIALTGILLSIDSLSFGIYRGLYPDRLVGGFSPVGTVGDFSRPLADAALPDMLTTTLAAYRRDGGAGAIKVVRLRSFAGMPQGVVVAGDGAQTHQSIFNAATGARAGLSGPNYPYTGFPLGWQLHEWVKELHRGDAFGLSGRVISLLGGFALAFLSASGLWMYVEQYRRRRTAGRPKLFWS